MPDLSYDFSDRRPRFPETLRVAAPRGFGAEIRRVAEARGMTVAEFVRNAVADKLTASSDMVRSS